MAISTTPWWSKDTVAVVTGANKGIGYEIVHALAKEGVTVVLTARDQSRGQAALDALKAEGLESIWFHPLDVNSSESAHVLATWLESKFGGIDILVNNAGVEYGPTGRLLDYENAKAIVGTNFGGVKNVTEALLPLLRPSPAGARIVNVTSRAGFYNLLNSETLRKTFRDEDKYTQELIESLAKKYLDDVKSGRSNEEGWLPQETPGKANAVAMYSESKIFLNGYAIALAKSLSKSQPESYQILVTSFCPGATDSDMLNRVLEESRESPDFEAFLKSFPVKSVADGADTGVWLSLLPKEELAPKHGRLFAERQEYPFGLDLKY